MQQFSTYLAVASFVFLGANPASKMLISETKFLTVRGGDDEQESH